VKSRLVNIPPLSGSKATVYTVLEIHPYGTRSALFERFISTYQGAYQPEVSDVVKRLTSIGKQTGALPTFFKMDEGLEADDMVCALFDIPHKYLRLYCIRISEKIIIIGSGGPKTTRAWQEDPVLSREVHKMMEVSARLRMKLDNGDFSISTDKLHIAWRKLDFIRN
jgi:hypothetical protein